MKYFLAIVFLCIAPAYAAQVGPLDGVAGPTLPAVGMPMLAAEESLPNTALPTMLQAKGLLAAATLEWARIEQEARGPERALALAKLAELSFLQNLPIVGETFVQEWRLLSPQKPLPEAVLVAQLQGQAGAAKAAVLQKLQALYPSGKASTAARFADIWQQAAQHGVVKQAWGLPQAPALNERLKFLRTRAVADYMLAVGLAVVPGFGHLLLQQWALAAVLLLGFAVFALAFLSACRHRHYAYAFVWAFPLVGLWLNSPISAALYAEKVAKATRLQAMAGWADLTPTYTQGAPSVK